MTESELQSIFDEINDIVDGLQGLSTMQLMGKAGDVSRVLKLHGEFSRALFNEYKLLNERVAQCLKKHPSEN